MSKIGPSSSTQGDLSRNIMAGQGRSPTVNVINITRRPEGGIVNVEMKRQEGLNAALAQPLVKSLPQQSIGAVNVSGVLAGPNSVNNVGNKSAPGKHLSSGQSLKYQSAVNSGQHIDQQILMQHLQGLSASTRPYGASVLPVSARQPSPYYNDVHSLYNRLTESVSVAPPSYNTRVHIQPANLQLHQTNASLSVVAPGSSQYVQVPHHIEDRPSSGPIVGNEIHIGVLTRDQMTSAITYTDATAIRGNGLPIGTQLISRLPGLQYDVIPPRTDGPSEAEKKLAALTLQLENEMRTASISSISGKQFFDPSQKSPPPYFGPHITTNFQSVPLKVSVTAAGLPMPNEVQGSVIRQIHSQSESSSCSVSDEDQRIISYRGLELTDVDNTNEYYGEFFKNHLKSSLATKLSVCKFIAIYDEH